MHLMQSDVDRTVIAFWLGHESPATTQQYLEAHLAMTERPSQSSRQRRTKRLPFRPTGRLLAFLDGL